MTPALPASGRLLEPEVLGRLRASFGSVPEAYPTALRACADAVEAHAARVIGAGAPERAERALELAGLAHLVGAGRMADAAEAIAAGGPVGDLAAAAARLAQHLRVESRLPEGFAFRQTLVATFDEQLDVYVAVLEECVTTALQACDGLDRAAAAGDLPGVSNAAHFIKGSAATVGAAAIAELASHIDRHPSAASDDHRRLREALREFGTAVALLQSLLAA